ncbi:MAG TPA: glycine--tRNA ligase subunit beta [Rhizomicrobium sp.]|jgi:glycyl-tRNA synthetase beta chain
MADLLLELFSEEIPARMQVQAAKDLERLVVGALSDRGLLFEGVRAFSGPRRLTLAMSGLPAKQPDVKEELKGPKVDAPAAALDGFLRKTGLTKEQLKIEKTPKGDVYLAVIDRKGRDTIEVLAEILPECFAKLPWPKSMRFPGSPVRWVRPLHGIVCMFDAEVVPFEFAGVTSGNTTMGHRFLSDGKPIKVRHFDDYEKALHDAHVILDAEQRKAIIFEELKAAAFVRGLELIPDEGLLDEVAGLAEWPVVLIGAIQDEFMDVPPEILQTSMRTHQKYFSLRDPKTGKMANRFALISNMVAEDGGKEIIAGNERVLRARLSDAKFFWDQDRKRTLESRVDDLKNIVFHAKLGTQYERVERIEALAGEIAEKIGADVAKAKRAARLAKADLTTGVVGEFPELQGVMGRYYALHDNEDIDVADAARDHYKPVGPSDSVPTSNVSIAVALADKLDQLYAFFAVGETPTGSGDPFALRRAALGTIGILSQNKLRISLTEVFAWSSVRFLSVALVREVVPVVDRVALGLEELGYDALAHKVFNEQREQLASPKYAEEASEKFRSHLVLLMKFFKDRVKVALRGKGTRHDLIDAVFSLGIEDDLVRLVARVEALQSFLKTDEGANLLAGYKRAANILKAEEKKDKKTFDGAPEAKLLSLPEEKALAEALGSAETSIAADVKAEKFVEAMGVMAKLRAPVDAFFDKVKVNDDDPKVRENRLKLLARLRDTLHLVADFSKIEG